jgi:hypothetical protein
LLVIKIRQISYTNKKRLEIFFDVGIQVLLSTSNIKLKTLGKMKLLPRWIGPFKIMERVDNIAYKLKLLDTLKTHFVFHVSLLKPYRVSGKIQPLLPPILEEDDELSFKEC